ncbi:NADP-dependent oxidoreductase [soil metagenome]
MPEAEVIISGTVHAFINKASNFMKAIRIHSYGGPEVLKFEEAPLPVPAKDEVLVKVHAAGVNPIDWKIRAGKMKNNIPVRFPLIPGWDVSGEVEEVGSSVLNFKKGDEVYGKPDLAKDGSYAEYIVVKAKEVSTKPKSIGHDKSAGIPLAGQTAWEALFTHGKLEKDQRVLIHGAAGGVGTYAVQLAKWKGAYVIATASEQNVDFVYSLGADEVIDYTTEDFASEVKEVDLVLDVVGGATQSKSLNLLKRGGKLVTTVKPEFEELAKKQGVELISFMMTSSPSVLQHITDLVDSGKIKPIINKVFPLKEAAAAQKFNEKEHQRGKVILIIR